MSGKATNQELARRNLPEPDFWPAKKKHYTDRLSIRMVLRRANAQRRSRVAFQAAEPIPLVPNHGRSNKRQISRRTNAMTHTNGNKMALAMIMPTPFRSSL
jgi:hypothetical protein